MSGPPKTILFIDGPRVGERFTVTKPTEMVYVALPDSTRVLTASFRTGIYVACRMQGSGHILHNRDQEMLFRYQGER